MREKADSRSQRASGPASFKRLQKIRAERGESSPTLRAKRAPAQPISHYLVALIEAWHRKGNPAGVEVA